MKQQDWISVETCPLCGSAPDRRQPFAEHSAGPAQLQYVLCTRCGLVFQTPRLTDAALQRYYQTEYSRRGHSDERDPEKDEWVQRRRAEHLMGVVRGLRPRIRRHLDVGASSGELLATFQHGFGSEGYGVEPGEAERKRAAAAGLQMVPTLEQLPGEATGTFDLVTLSHVLEHLPDPVETLRRIRREWLAENGLVLVETPNLYGHGSFELGHLAAFTAQTLRSALTIAGLRVIDLWRHGRPYSRLLPLFLLGVAQMGPHGIAPVPPAARPVWIRIRRSLGMARLRAARFAARRLLGKRKLQPWAD